MCIAGAEKGVLWLGDKDASQRKWYLDSPTRKSLHSLSIGTYPWPGTCHYWDTIEKKTQQKERRGWAKGDSGMAYLRRRCVSE